MKWITNKYYTPFDALELFDKVLLHELTHTFSAGDLDDVSTIYSPLKSVPTSNALILCRWYLREGIQTAITKLMDGSLSRL